MEWEGDKANQPEPAWSCNPGSMRWKTTERPIFNHPIECTWALLEFYLYAKYISHDNSTLSYMEDTLCSFQTIKEDFLLDRASKKSKAKANTLRKELIRKRKVDKERNAQTWTLSKKGHRMNAWWDYISHEIEVSKELAADFNFPTIHLMSHWVEQIPQYGPVQQYSAKRHGQVHKPNFKDGWNASNYILKNLPQAITLQHHICCFEIRDLHLQSPAQSWEHWAAACKFVPSGAHLAAPRSSKSYAKPQFMGPQNSHDGKHSDAMIPDFSALLDNTQDGMHPMAIYNGKRKFFKHKSCKKNIYIGWTIACIGALYLPWYSGSSWEFKRWIHISDALMNRKPELGQRGQTECQGVGKATAREALWCAEWSSPMATAMSMENQAPERRWSFGWVLVSPASNYNTWNLG